ncbi:hypothetical protein [macacine gammaherpesvirus 13]|uniref:Herpesvirus leader protein domain-containing protein n=1 Tax=macacine gammaherpesvirus 13 TaxID=2341050 RepID=A0A3G1T4C0_9GAMA|nr:hypothetical protein QKT43_gp04 [Macaca arctoides gammaherpesvirus 1]AYA49794.1 hypothetical protein [Macaca arctoides gammaherpesvirus 1]
MADPSEASGPAGSGPTGLGPQGPFGDLLKRRRHRSPTDGDPEGPRRVCRRVLVEEEQSVSSGPVRRADPSEASGPAGSGPTGLGPQGPFGDLLKRRRHRSPTDGDPEGPRRVCRRVLVEEEQSVSSGPVRGRPQRSIRTCRVRAHRSRATGPFGDLLKRRRHRSPTDGDPEGPRRVCRRVLVEEEQSVSSGPVRGRPQRSIRTCRVRAHRSRATGPFGDLLKRRRHRSPTDGDPEGPRRVCRRVLVEEEQSVSSGPVRGRPQRSIRTCRVRAHRSRATGPFGDLLKRRRHRSPTDGDPEGPRRVCRRVLVEEEQSVSSGPVRPSGPVIQPGARSWRDWLDRARQRTDPQAVTTTTRRRVYIEEEET